MAGTAEQVRRDNAKRAAYKRAWENEHDRHVCACGNKMGVGAHRQGAMTCWECEKKRRRTMRMERARTIERMWADGASMQDIGRALGTTAKTVGADITRLRQEGLADLPYRHIKPDGWTT